MKKITLHTSSFALLLATAFAMTGCADYDAIVEATDDGAEVDGDVIALRINRPGDRQMQKAPAGGQKGDGFMKGNQWSEYLKDVNYDYALQDLCLFVYRSERDDALNSSPTTEFLYKVYIPHDKLEVHFDRENDTHDGHDIDAYYTSVKIALDGFRKRGYHRIAAVGNVGDITDKVNNLGHFATMLSPALPSPTREQPLRSMPTVQVMPLHIMCLPQEATIRNL